MFTDSTLPRNGRNRANIGCGCTFRHALPRSPAPLPSCGQRLIEFGHGLGRGKKAGGGCRPDSVPRRAASIHLGRALPRGSSSQPGDLTHTRWDAGTGNPRPPYSALLRMGFTVPPPFPEGRCALTAPFHPYPRLIGGGLLSAALSLALPRPGVTRHAACQESGLSSTRNIGQRTPASFSPRTL